MAAVLKTVPVNDAKIKGATDSYIDDTMIDVTKMSAEEVADHLKIIWTDCLLNH